MSIKIDRNVSAQCQPFSFQVYFADARLDYIEFVNYDGSGRQTVVADDHVRQSAVLYFVFFVFVFFISFPRYSWGT